MIYILRGIRYSRWRPTAMILYCIFHKIIKDHKTKKMADTFLSLSHMSIILPESATVAKTKIYSKWRSVAISNYIVLF